MSNHLCNMRIKNNNPKSPIAYFKISTVRMYHSYSGESYLDEIKSLEEFYDNETPWLYEEPFYHVCGERYIDDKRSGTIFLGAFDNIEQAKNYVYNITGEYPEE